MDVNLDIEICPTTGGNFTLTIPKTLTVQGLKHILEKRLKLPMDRINLLYKDRILKTGLLTELGVSKGCKFTLLPNVETGFNSQKPDRSIMQVLETLTDKQVNDFLAGISPLTLAMRLGDHMMFIQLQLSSSPFSSKSTSAQRQQIGSKKSTANSVSSTTSSMTSLVPPPPASNSQRNHHLLHHQQQHNEFFQQQSESNHLQCNINHQYHPQQIQYMQHVQRCNNLLKVPNHVDPANNLPQLKQRFNTITIPQNLGIGQGCKAQNNAAASHICNSFDKSKFHAQHISNSQNSHTAFSSTNKEHFDLEQQQKDYQRRAMILAAAIASKQREMRDLEKSAAGNQSAAKQQQTLIKGSYGCNEATTVTSSLNHRPIPTTTISEKPKNMLFSNKLKASSKQNSGLIDSTSNSVFGSSSPGSVNAEEVEYSCSSSSSDCSISPLSTPPSSPVSPLSPGFPTMAPYVPAFYPLPQQPIVAAQPEEVMISSPVPVSPHHQMSSSSQGHIQNIHQPFYDHQKQQCSSSSNVYNLAPNHRNYVIHENGHPAAHPYIRYHRRYHDPRTSQQQHQTMKQQPQVSVLRDLQQQLQGDSSVQHQQQLKRCNSHHQHQRIPKDCKPSAFSRHRGRGGETDHQHLNVSPLAATTPAAAQDMCTSSLVNETSNLTADKVHVNEGHEIVNGAPRHVPKNEERAPISGKGAVINSMQHLGKGVFSGTFSGTLNPAFQDGCGKPRNSLSTIVQILSDLLKAAHPGKICSASAGHVQAAGQHYHHSSSQLMQQQQQNSLHFRRRRNRKSSSAGAPSMTQQNKAHQKNIVLDEERKRLERENQMMKNKVQQVQMMLEQRRQKRIAKREAKASPYSCYQSVTSGSNDLEMTSEKATGQKGNSMDDKNIAQEVDDEGSTELSDDSASFASGELKTEAVLV